MQTFLPYADFNKSAECLDMRRLGKQRLEAKTIYDILIAKKTHAIYTTMAWVNHPAVLMWEGYERALAAYYNAILTEWCRRGYNNTMSYIKSLSGVIIFQEDVSIPDWLGNKKFHAAHRSNLLRKKYEHYSQFGWTEPNDLPYIWPVKKMEVKTNGKN